MNITLDEFVTIVRTNVSLFKRLLSKSRASIRAFMLVLFMCVLCPLARGYSGQKGLEFFHRCGNLTNVI